jgi:hypothetical protein
MSKMPRDIAGSLSENAKLIMKTSGMMFASKNVVATGKRQGRRVP